LAVKHVSVEIEEAFCLSNSHFKWYNLTWYFNYKESHV